ncbi:MAG TPA: hypothetical protein ENK32_07140 [Anaerolineae bacterium]|nr:hypothetical protein [Anaerolineae bacterium]
MRIEKKKDEELAQRKGLTKRTIAQVIWLGLSFVLGYFLAKYLFDSGVLTPSLFYVQLFIPRSVPEWGLLAMTTIAIVIVLQVMFGIGFILASPEGRRRTGDPSLQSRHKDPYDDRHY